MKRRILVLSLLLAGAAQAQIYQVAQPTQSTQAATVKRPQAAQPATAARPANVAPAMARPAAAGPNLELDQKAINQQLTQRIKQLREENASLREQNAKLQARINEFTRLGGSEVHAYCPTGTTSRNTAGATADCASLGGYTCEEVSGLCRTQCQTTDMCAPGWTCDTGAQQCVYTGGG